MSLILEEFEKENIQEALYNFEDAIYNYNVINNHHKIKESYRTPTNYVSDDTRGLSYNEVSESTLDFIISKCRKCPLEHRKDATKALLSKYYEKIKDRYTDDEIQEKLINIKQKIVESLEQTADDLSLGEDFDFGTLPKGEYSELLYLLQIKIGGNYLKKIGYTSRDSIKPRVAEIKSSYRSNAKKVFNINIKPVYIYSMDNAQELEKEFILKIENYGAKFDTKYTFAGSDECLTGKYSKLADNVFSEITELLDRDSFQIVFG